MSKIPEELKYTKDHEWIRVEADGSITIGITDHAQESLGDVTFVELPSPGDSFEEGDAFGVVESVKAASDLYMPVAGEVIAANENLDQDPEMVNRSPYDEAWMIKVNPGDPSETEKLLSAEDYSKLT